MEGSNMSCFRVCIWVLCFAVIASLFKHSDARKTTGLVKASRTKKLELVSTIMSLVVDQPTQTSNSNPYVSSPLSLPPFESVAPNYIPENAPPYCYNPPLTSQTPSTTPSETSPSPPTPVAYNIPPALPAPSLPTNPMGLVPSPPVFSCIPGPPSYIPGGSSTVPSPYEGPSTVPSPYEGPSTVPSPYQPTVSPPPYYEPSPPESITSPPFYIPSPPAFLPNPPVFLPPIVYPPPTFPRAPSVEPPTALWCVAKPSVPEPIIQEAMNYACGSGADCDSIQPNGPCFEPNALFAHASYAFNSYFQRTKSAGGTCDFGGTAILVTVDPSSDGCHFEYN